MSREEERRLRRMLSNRESARRSRVRKHEQLNDMLILMDEIREENGRILVMVKVRRDLCARVEAENRVIRAQVVELEERLRYMSELLRFFDAGGGVVMEIQV